MKHLFAVAVLLAATYSVASAKTYSISLQDQTMVAGTTLPAGEYKVAVDGGNAIFTNLRNREKATVPVKIETGSSKHEVTAVTTNLHDGARQIESIGLAGTAEVLEFSVQ